jgi:DNA invertase Pin-like site-specific DNA recombinase
MNKPIALAYVRVSTNRQADTGHSLVSQAARLIELATAKGYQVELIEETGSGRKQNRPRLSEALARLDKGQAQALFTLDIDRLARSVLHLSTIMENARRRGWRLVIASSDIDTSTPGGEMLLNVLSASAQFESRMISERVKRQHEARRDRGITWGLDQGFKGSLNASARERIAAMKTQGLSLRAIGSQLALDGLTPPRGGDWHAATIRAILQSPQTRALMGEVAA